MYVIIKITILYFIMYILVNIKSNCNIRYINTIYVMAIFRFIMIDYILIYFETVISDIVIINDISIHIISSILTIVVFCFVITINVAMKLG